MSSRCTTSLPVEGSSGRGSSRWSGCHTPRPELGEEAGQDGGVALAEDRARPQHRRLQPVQHRPLRCFDHRTVGVAKCDGAAPHAVLDEFVAIGVPHMTPVTSNEKAGGIQWKLVVPFGVRVTATGDDLMRPALQLL